MSSDSSSSIVSNVWNYAHVLKNEGVGYGDYVEQSLEAALEEFRSVEEALDTTDLD